MDQDWRAAERRWRENPTDQEALRRAIDGRRRDDLEVPAAMRDALVQPARTLRSDARLRVWVGRDDGGAELLGSTPRPAGGATAELAIPGGRLWWVEPADGSREALAAAVDAVERDHLPGLSIPRGQDSDDDRADLWERVGRLAHLEWLAVRASGPLGEPAARAIGSLRRLARLGLNAHLDDALLATAVGGLVELRRLELPGGAGYSDAGLATLAGLHELAELTLNLAVSPSEVTDAGLAGLAASSSLRRLELPGAWGLSAAAFAGLACSESLRELVLNGRQIHELEDSWLEPFVRLTHLGLRQAYEVEGACLNALTGLTSLRIDGAGWFAAETLGVLPELRRLEVPGLDIGLTELAGHLHPDARPRLEVLDVSANPLHDEGIAALGDLPRLRRLLLETRGVGLSDAALVTIARQRGLRELVLAGNGALTGARLDRLAELTELTRLDLSRTGVGDGSLARFAHPGLRELHLSATPIAGAGLTALAACPNLERVALADGERLGAAAWPAIAAAKSIRRLDLDRCPGVDDAALRELAALPELRRLHLAGCEAITGAGIAALAAAPKLAVLDLTSCALGETDLAGIGAVTQVADLCIRRLDASEDAGDRFLDEHGADRTILVEEPEQIFRLDLFSWQPWGVPDGCELFAAPPAPPEGSSPFGGMTSLYDEMLAENPDDLEALRARFGRLRMMGDHRGALADVRRLAELQPDEIEHLESWVELAERAGDAAAIEEGAVRWLERDPEASTPLALRALVLVDAGDFAGALEASERALEKLIAQDDANPSVAARTAAIQAECQRQLGDDAGTIAAASAALERFGPNAMLLTIRAGSRLALGERAGAAADLDRALEIDALALEARFQRARIAREDGDVATARGHLDQLLALAPRNAAGLHARASLRSKEKDLDGALEDIARGLEVDPGDAALSNLRGTILDERGDHAGALAAYETALAATPPGDPNAMITTFNLGETKVKLGDHAGALGHLTLVLDDTPDDAEALVLRAQAHRGLDDADAATADLERAAEIDGDGEHGAKARELLTELRGGASS